MKPFIKNMLKSTIKTSVQNTDDISSPIVYSIDKLPSAKDIAHPIVSATIDMKNDILDAIKEISSKSPFEGISMIKGDKGDKGDSPSDEELKTIIKPLIPEFIPEPIKGDDGKDYVLTVKDKKDIAKSIKVPVVEKVVETIIEKQPIITNNVEVREVALTDSAEKIKEKLESLEGDDRLDAKAIKNLPKPSFGGGSGIKRIDGANDTRIISPTNGQTLVWNSSRQVWENSSVGGGTGTVDTIVAGNNIDVDSTDPANPIVSVETLNLADISDVTASAAELNVLDGIPATLTATELGYVDGVTSNIQAQINAITGASGISRTVIVTSGAFTAGSTAATDYVYLVAGAHAVALPTAVGNSNRYTFKNNHSAAITITPNGVETVEVSASIQISPQDSVDLISNNTSNWLVI